MGSLVATLRGALCIGAFPYSPIYMHALTITSRPLHIEINDTNIQRALYATGEYMVGNVLCYPHLRFTILLRPYL